MKFRLSRTQAITVASLAASLLAVSVTLAWMGRESLLSGHGRVVSVPAPRGAILAQDGTPLAWSTPVLQVWVKGAAFQRMREHHPDEATSTLDRLAQLTGQDAAWISRLLQGSADTLWLSRTADPGQRRALEALEPWGVVVEAGQARHQLADAGLGALLGWTDTQHQGIDGLEHGLDGPLSGLPGTVRQFRLGLLGTVSVPLPDQLYRRGHPVKGQDQRLTIDVAQQRGLAQKMQALMTERQARLAGALLARVEGAITASVSLPAPALTSREALQEVPRSDLVLSQTWEPGLLLAPLVASGAPVDDAAAAAGRQAELPGGIQLPWVPAEALQARLIALGFKERPELAHPATGKGRLRPADSWREMDHLAMHRGRSVSGTLVQQVQAYQRLILGQSGAKLRLLASESAMPATAASASATPLGGRGWRASIQLLPAAQRVQVPGGGEAWLITDCNDGWQSDPSQRLSGMAVYPADAPQWILGFTLKDTQGADRDTLVASAKAFMRDALGQLVVKPASR